MPEQPDPQSRTQVEEILIFPDGRTIKVSGGGTSPPTQRPQFRNSGPTRKQYLWSLGLFLVTCYTTWSVGDSRYSDGFGYMIPVMAILLAHEMGHYIASLIYRVPATPPFFIPMPYSPLGTFGAVIVKQGGREDRKALFDIAIAGPLAGLVLAIPVCIYGAATAQAVPVDQIPSDEFQFIAPPLMKWIVWAVRGDWPAGMVLESAILDAGWVGIFITALNLIPIGQLDGGHILYTLLGRKAHYVAGALIAGALAYMFITGNLTFMLMLFLIIMMGPYHPPTSNDRAPLGWFRVVLGCITLPFIFIGFTPTPIVIGG